MSQKVGREKKELSGSELLYYKHRNDISQINGVLLHKKQIIMPDSWRKSCLKNLHMGHLGINKSKSRAKETVWWPNINKHIEDLIQNCEICLKNRNDRSEPLISSETPQRPWEVVGTDLFEIKGVHYLVVQDYYSKYPEVAKLNSLKAKETIFRMKDIFARHGIPVVVRSDNGPEYNCYEFKRFAKEYNFEWISSSPYHPASNGLAESGVKSMKSILTKCEDVFLGLLAYRNTKLECGFSPSELLFGRRLREILPCLDTSLDPKMIY